MYSTKRKQRKKTNMKIYSNLIDLATPANRTFYVAPHSDFKLAVKILVNGVVDDDITFTVYDGENELTSDGSINGFTTYALQSTATGEKQYKIVCSNGQVAYIKQVTTDSTVFEVGGSGSIPEGNFVKSVNGEYPVESNIDVSKLLFKDEEGEDSWINGQTIAESLNNIDEELDKKADLEDVN